MTTTKKYKVVYDVDDVLWGLNRRVFDALKLDISLHITYDIDINPYFSKADVARINAKFADGATFEKMEFYPGAADILAIEPLGAEVYIHSNCYSQAVADAKLHQLRELLPLLPEERIAMNFVSSSITTKKLDQDILVLADDSPYNIAKSHALVNIMPNKTFNVSSDAEKIMTDSGKIMCTGDYRQALPELLERGTSCVVRAEDLLEVNQMVHDIILMQKEIQHAA